MFAAGAAFFWSDFDLKKGGWQYQKRAKHFSNAGFRILDGGWDRFEQTLDALRSKRKRLQQSWYGSLERWLMNDHSPELTELKNFMLAHARSRQPLSSKRKLLRERIDYAPRITMREAAKLIGHSPANLWRALKQLELSDHAFGSHETHTISLEAVDRLKHFFKNALPASEAAALLGVTATTLRQWTRAGFLAPLFPVGTSSRTLYLQSDLESFVSRVASVAPVVDATGPNQMIFAKGGHWHHVTPADVMRELLNGKLKPLGRLQSSNPMDLSQVIIAKADIRRLDARKLKGLSVNVAATLLLLRADTLRSVTPKSTRHKTTEVIAFEDLTTVDETYLSLGRMSQLCNLSRKEVARRLRNQKVVREERLGSTHIFLRSEVEAVLGPLPRLSLKDLKARFA